MLAVKEEYNDMIKVIDTESKYVLWFKIDRKLLHENVDMICGVVYIPPESSKYCGADPYGEVENELMNFSQNEKNVILGNFNVRTAKEFDFIDGDESTDSTNSDFLHVLEESNILLIRDSQDKTKNNFGNFLLNFCKRNNLFICNGRYGVKSSLFTCKNASVVDYAIVSADVFSLNNSFEI